MENKRIKQILPILLTVFSIIFGLVISSEKVAAEERKTTVVSVSEFDYTYLRHPEAPHSPMRLVDRLRDDNGQANFCINFNLPSPNGLEYTSFEILDNATSYLLNAYHNGNANLTGNKAYDEYLIQAAIHNIKTPNDFSLYENGKKLIDLDGTTTKTVDRIIKLVAEAKAAPDQKIPNFENSLSLSADSLEFTLNKDNNQYESQVITVSLQGDGKVNVAVTGNENIKLIDETGQSISSITNGQQIQVVVPREDVENSIDVALSLEGNFKQSYNLAVRYGGQSGYQDIARYEAFEQSETLNVAIGGRIERVSYSGKIEVFKEDQDKKALPGAEFTLTDEESGEIQQVELTSETGQVTFDIAEGRTYTLEETKNPTGYKGSFKQVGITLEHDGQIFKYTATNTLYQGKIEVLKEDQDKKVLPEAEFTLTDEESGEKQVQITDKDGKVSFDIVYGHTYTLEETKNPRGYTGNFKQEGITLENDGQIFKYSVQNKKIEGTIVKSGSQDFSLQKNILLVLMVGILGWISTEIIKAKKRSV